MDNVKQQLSFRLEATLLRLAPCRVGTYHDFAVLERNYVRWRRIFHKLLVEFRDGRIAYNSHYDFFQFVPSVDVTSSSGTANKRQGGLYMSAQPLEVERDAALPIADGDRGKMH